MSNKRDLKEFIRMIARTPSSGDGWRNISDQLLPMAEGFVAMEPSLFEFSKPNQIIRLTLKGEGALWAIT